MAVDSDVSSDLLVFSEATRKYLAERCPPSVLRGLRHDPVGFDRDFWPRGADLGWTSLLVPSEDGGGSVSGDGVCDLALLAFEFGRSAAPGPLTATNVVAAALARSGTVDQKVDILPGLMSGTLIASWAHSEPRPFDRLGVTGVRASRRDGVYVLDGHKAPVESAAIADLLLVTAIDDGGELVQLLVATDLPGVSMTPLNTIDLTRRYDRVEFKAVAVPVSARLGEPGGATERDVEQQLQIAVVIQLAEMVGSMDRGIEYTTDWLFNRYSFGRPLASYQALKHRFADVRAWLEAAHAIADAAARHVQDDSGRASEYVSVGKSFLGIYALETLQECIQFHGGIGVTFEHNLHLHLRRAVLNAQLYGTVADHRERLASMLEVSEDSRG